MSILVINDLPHSVELNRPAMSVVRGGFMRRYTETADRGRAGTVTYSDFWYPETTYLDVSEDA